MATRVEQRRWGGEGTKELLVGSNTLDLDKGVLGESANSKRSASRRLISSEI